MQISTSQFYTFNRQNMLSLQGDADKLQTQISTGKRVNAPSDDSVAWRRLQSLSRSGADDTAYMGNMTLVSATLSQADVTLSSVADALQQAKELAIKANSGTLSQSDRGAIADQLDSILKNLIDYANVKDSRGAAIFANGDADAVTANPGGGYTIAANGPVAVPIGATQTIAPGDSAARLYAMPGGGDILSSIAALTNALRGTGDVSAVAGTTGDALQVQNDQVASVQASLGARAARVDLQTTYIKEVATDREATRSSLEDTDVTTAITDLQKTMTILSATQASFTKLSQLSLFDYLR